MDFYKRSDLELKMSAQHVGVWDKTLADLRRMGVLC